MTEGNEQVQAQQTDKRSAYFDNKVEILFRRHDGAEFICWIEPNEDGTIPANWVRAYEAACVASP